jgi:hypothetical protein
VPITPVVAAPRDLDAEQQRDIERFEQAIEPSTSPGEIDEDVFRVMRLNNGIYGQRQGGTNQMVRIKLPAGTITPEQLEMMGHIVRDLLARLGAHHHPPERAGALRRAHQGARGDAAARRSGLTTREACGDTVRNVMACHLAGACPHEVLDVTPWAEATFEHFVRNPLGQRLPRKFKINFSGCSTDCGQAMFNDVGRVAATRTLDDGTTSRASGLHRRRPRREPASGPRPRGLHLPRGAAAHHRGRTAGVRPDRQPGQQAAGPDEVAGRHARASTRCAPGAQGPPHPARVVVVARRHPRDRAKVGDAPAGAPATVRSPPSARASASSSCPRPLQAVGGHQRHPRRGERHRLGGGLRGLGDITADAVPVAGGDPARARRRRPAHEPSERGVPRPHRGPDPVLYARLDGDRHGPSRCRAGPRRRRLPRRRHLQHRRHPVARPGQGHRRGSSRRRVSPRSAASASTSRAAPTAAASTTPPTSGSSGPSDGPTGVGPRVPDAARRLRGRRADPLRRQGPAAPRQGGTRGGVRVIRRFAAEREAGETFRGWLDRSGGAKPWWPPG